MRKISIPIIIVVLIGLGLYFINQQSKSTQITTQEANQKTSQSESADAPKNCSGIPIAELTEGPYYKTGSPKRQKITEANAPGVHLILKGYVFDTNCQPVANAWLDFWHADGDGNYDNQGFNLRGHQYTDENGFFRLETVIPGQYPGRTEHIHFKVRKSEESQVITSQLFFPEGSTNSTDSIFDESMVVTLGEEADGSTFASYNIVIP